MPDRAIIEKLIKDAYAARTAKDLDTVMGFFVPNATFHFAGSPAGGGERAGRCKLARDFCHARRGVRHP